MSQARDLADLGSSAEQGTITGDNLIINGDMAVAQRGDVTGVSSGYGGADRYNFVTNSAARVTLSQDTDVPSNQGFVNSQKVDVTTADTTVSTGDYAQLRQKIEAQNLQHLKYGTSEAKKVTLQFWVKSPKTGTHVLELQHSDASYYNDQTYNIATANTWQKVTMTFDGYQTTAINNDNGHGLQVIWWLFAGATYSGGTLSENTWHNTQANRAAGQVNVMDSTSNNFYITGVKLEVGSTATPFKHESYAENELKCKRYYQKIADRDVTPANSVATISRFVANAYATTNGALQHHFEIEMRDAPTVTYYHVSIVSGKTAAWYDGAWRGADASTSQIYSNAVHIELANPSPNFDGDYAAYIAQLNFTMESEL